MENSDRYYIQSTYESGKFVKKFSFLSPLAYTYSNSYSPNIWDFPLSFTTLASANDYICNTLFSEFYSNTPYEISYSFMEEIKSLKIVKLDNYSGNTSFYSGYYDSQNIDNPITYVRKAAFKWIANAIFCPRLTNYYIVKTNFNSRQMGIVSSSSEYIVDAGGNFNDTGMELQKYGVTYNTSWQDGLFSFKDVNDLNFARLSVDGARNWKITREEELYNLESNIAYSQPINLNHTTPPR